MGNPEKSELPKENFENLVFETENAAAQITVNFENKTVWINDLRAFVRGQGFGSKLLDELKKKYPDYVLTGNASPTDFYRPEKPNDKEMEKAMDFGWSPASKKDKEFQDPGFELTSAEQSFRKDIAERFHNWKKNEPVPRLFNFYKKNGFILSSDSGWFESHPPHRLNSETNK